MEQITNEQNDLGNFKPKPSRKKLKITVAVILIILLGFAAGYMTCKTGRNLTGISDLFTGGPKKGEVKKFTNYDEVKKFLEENPVEGEDYSYSSPSLGGLGLFSLGSARSSGSRSGSGTGSIPQWGTTRAPSNVPSSFESPIYDYDSYSDSDYSTTNIQVGGVDEDDIVKSDGKYIYAVSGNNIQIIEAYPISASNVVSTIRLSSKPLGIYVNGNKLAVYGRNANLAKEDFYDELKPVRLSSSYTYLKIFDLSDIEKPKEERDIDFEGSYNNSRMIGDYIYFITSNSKYNYYSQDKDALPVPFAIENGELPESGGKDMKCRGCPDVYYMNIPYKSYNFMTVAAVSMSDKDKKMNSSVFLLDGRQNNMFVSSGNIYITFTEYITERELTVKAIKEIVMPKLGDVEKAKIAEIERTKSYILSSREKTSKVDLVVSGYYDSLSKDDQKKIAKEVEDNMEQKYADISKELEKTKIHKIAIDKDRIEYKNSGEATGQVLDQFSMNESNGYFYIATTKGRMWSQFSPAGERDSYSNVYVLDKDMKVTGKVENIAKGETIYSVRFMQNRAYMVTFRQMDPLFVIDLADAKKPKVLGELKVPGYSSYLHPYDENTLIGIGKETDERGSVIGGIKLSLFDVSDVAKPREIDKYVFGGRSSDSAAINDHKAFLFSKDKNLLVIPVDLRADYRLTAPEREKMQIPPVDNDFNGVAVFNVDNNGFELKGKVSNSPSTYGMRQTSSYYSYSNPYKIQRSLYIKDVLYTLSDKNLKASQLSDLGELKYYDLANGTIVPSYSR